MRKLIAATALVLCLFGLTGCWLFDVWGTDPQDEEARKERERGETIVDPVEMTLDGVCEVTLVSPIFSGFSDIQLRCQDATFTTSSDLGLVVGDAASTEFVFHQDGATWELASVEIIEGAAQDADEGDDVDPIELTLDGICEVAAVTALEDSSNSVRLQCDDADFSVISELDLEVNDLVDAEFIFHQTDEDGLTWELDSLEVQ